MSTAVRVYGTCWAVSTPARRSAVRRTYIRRGGRRRRRRSGGVRTGRSIPTAPPARSHPTGNRSQYPAFRTGWLRRWHWCRVPCCSWCPPGRPAHPHDGSLSVGPGRVADEGFVTGTEFAAKNAELLARLSRAAGSPAARFHPPPQERCWLGPKCSGGNSSAPCVVGGPGGGSWSVCRNGGGCGMSGWRVSRCRRGGAQPGCSPGLGVR